MTIAKGGNFDENKVIKLMVSMLPAAEMTSNSKKEMSYILKEEDSSNFRQLFVEFESE